jgi:tetratricopeptide (TPR) repeat protein
VPKFASTAGVLVGRDDELTILRAALDAAGSGRPSVVLVVGEAGIGKTRLADEAAVMARAGGMRVLRGEADASRREPKELWRGVYRSLGVERVSDLSLPAEERRWEQLESLSDALISCAPALVVLEDLQWADAIAIWLLEHLPRMLADAPVALLVTSRDHEPDMPRIDGVRRVSRLVKLGGLDVEGVRRLATAETADAVDAVALRARTGGNPLFVRELVRSPDSGGVISDVLERSLERFDADTRALLGTAAVAGSGTPLAVLARATGSTMAVAAERLDPAVRDGVLDEVTPRGVCFQHALFAEAAERRCDTRDAHDRLATAWDTVSTLEGRSFAARHRLRAAAGTVLVAEAVDAACEVAAELVAAGQQERAAALLRDAREVGAECLDRPELRANVALDLANVLHRLGDLDPALNLFHEAAELARGSSDPLTRARAEAGPDLWVTAFVPDLPRVRRLEDALDALPPQELRLRAALLGRLTIVAAADVDATDQVRAWAGEAVAVARATGDPTLIARALINQTMSAKSRSEVDGVIVAADEVVRLAERAGRSDLALHGHQRRAGYYLNRGDLGAANECLGSAEVLAALLPSAAWRYNTLVQRTTLLALSGNRSAATAAMYEAAVVGAGHVEPVVILGCEAMHQLMLFDLYGHVDARAEEVVRIATEMFDEVPSPVLQVQKGFGAQLFGDESSVYEVLHRYGSRPDRLVRSVTGDHLLRVFGDTVARSGAAAYAGPAYRALIPYAGLLNVGGGHSAGLPVDDVLGRLAALDGDTAAAVRHARDAVALARSMLSPPLLVHCLDHLADAVERTGEDGADVLRREADALAATADVVRPRRAPPSTRVVRDAARSAALRRDGRQWVLTTPLGNARLPDSNGLGQLARLLTTPGAEVSAVELAGRAHAPVAADLGPRLDVQAKRAYRRRLLELQADVDDAEAANDPVRGERAHIEMDALLRELKRAVGLAGRDRPTGSDAERARVNVARSLRRAIAAVADQAPLLGAHLEESVRTGGHCIYLPEPAAALSWTVATAGASPSGGTTGR